MTMVCDGMKEEKDILEDGESEQGNSAYLGENLPGEEKDIVDACVCV